MTCPLRAVVTDANPCAVASAQPSADSGLMPLIERINAEETPQRRSSPRPRARYRHQSAPTRAPQTLHKLRRPFWPNRRTPRRPAATLSPNRHTFSRYRFLGEAAKPIASNPSAPAFSTTTARACTWDASSGRCIWGGARLAALTKRAGSCLTWRKLRPRADRNPASGPDRLLQPIRQAAHRTRNQHRLGRHGLRLRESPGRMIRALRGDVVRLVPLPAKDD
jgi:hypothetical protein